MARALVVLGSCRSCETQAPDRRGRFGVGLTLDGFVPRARHAPHAGVGPGVGAGHAACGGKAREVKSDPRTIVMPEVALGAGTLRPPKEEEPRARRNAFHVCPTPNLRLDPSKVPLHGGPTGGTFAAEVCNFVDYNTTCASASGRFRVILTH